MDPVSVALLAALLPTGILIFILSCLSLYLCLRRQNPHTQSLDLQVQPAPIEELERERSWTIPTGPYPSVGQHFLGRKIHVQFSEPGNPDLDKDMYMMLSGLRVWVHINVHRNEEVKDNETRVREILELLGYRGIPPAAFFKLLQRPATRWEVLDHLLLTIAIERASLDGDPQSSLLPFPPDVHKDVRAYIEALRGIQFSPQVATTLMKIPTTIAGKQDWPKANRDRTTELFQRLVFPYGDRDKMPYTSQGFYFSPGFIEKDLDSIVYVRFLMLESPKQLEFRWPETSETSFPTEPDIYANAGDDGVLLDEPKLWRKGKVVTILDDGAVLGNYKGRSGQDGPDCMGI